MSWLRSLGVISLGFLVNGCASPVDKLWPLPPDVPAHTIIVSIDTIHAMIAFPVSQSRPDSRHPPLYEEWGYAEQAWYLEQRMGLGGVLRALFWESSGVVEVGLHEQLWSQRTPQLPAEQFTFRLSENSYVRLRHYLEASKADGALILKVGGSEFYRATDSYHVFHNCHHYAAGALRAAGLPISTFWALTRGMFAAQLQRAEQMAESVDSSQAGDHDGTFRPRGYNRANS